MTGYKLEPLNNPGHAASVTSGRARERSADREVQPGGLGCAAGDLQEGQQAPAQPRTHSLCSLLWTPVFTGTPLCAPPHPTLPPSTRDGGVTPKTV